MNKNEVGICELDMHLEKLFVCALISKNDDIISV